MKLGTSDFKIWYRDWQLIDNGW